MITNIRKQQTHPIYRLISGLVAFTFIFSSAVLPQRVYAQTPILNLPAPGTMIPLSSTYVPTMIKGIMIQPDNPLQFDFIIDTGDTNLEGEVFKDEATKLIKYFLASLTLKEDEMWVNLSPYEQDHIIPKVLGQTELGRDMLAQDYILKQLTASLMYPEKELGKKFWDRVHAKAQSQFGTTEIPTNTFNKVWIVPESANVFEHERGAYVVDSHLKVMLESDYEAMAEGVGSRLQGSEDQLNPKPQSPTPELSKELIREILLPEIEHEVNNGKTFANLRQIFNSMILATWYKQNLKESLLSQVYVNKNRIKGVDQQDPAINQQIYDQYIQAFKKGVYNYIKEDYDSATQQIIPRKYFSGGVVNNLDQIVRTKSASSPLAINASIRGISKIVSARFKPEGTKIHLQQFEDIIAASSPVEESQPDASMLEQQPEWLKIPIETVRRRDEYFLFTEKSFWPELTFRDEVIDPDIGLVTFRKEDEHLQRIDFTFFVIEVGTSEQKIVARGEGNQVAENLLANEYEPDAVGRKGYWQRGLTLLLLTHPNLTWESDPIGTLEQGAKRMYERMTRDGRLLVRQTGKSYEVSISDSGRALMSLLDDTRVEIIDPEGLEKTSRVTKRKLNKLLQNRQVQFVHGPKGQGGQWVREKVWIMLAKDLQQHVSNRQEALSVNVDSLGQAIDELLTHSPKLQGILFDGEKLASDLNIFVDHTAVMTSGQEWRKISLPENSMISITISPAPVMQGNDGNSEGIRDGGTSSPVPVEDEAASDSPHLQTRWSSSPVESEGSSIADEVILDKRDDRTAWITINRPKSLNSLSKSVQARMIKLFRELKEDDGVDTVILKANGGFFSTGADLSERKGMSDVQTLREVERINEVVDAFEDLGKTKETIAVMQTAFGGGLELALAAKKRLMYETVESRKGKRETFLVLSEVTLGILPGAGGTQRLPRLVGEHMAQKMTLSARQVNADMAKKIGLVDEVIGSPEKVEEMEEAVQKVIADTGKRTPVIDEVYDVSNKGKKYSLQVEKKDDGTAWLTVGNFDSERKKTNVQIVEELELDPEVRAVVFSGLKNDFFRATDILDRIKNFAKPTVAVMRGSMDAKAFPLLRAFVFHVGVKGNNYNSEISVEEAASQGLVEGVVDHVGQLSKAVKDFVGGLTRKVAPISYALGKLAIIDGMKTDLKTGLSVVQVNAYDLTVPTRERNESLIKVAKKEPRVFTWNPQDMNRLIAYTRLYRQRALAHQYGVDLVEQRAKLQGTTVVLNEVTNRDGVQGERKAHENSYSAGVKLGVSKSLATAGYVRQELGAFPSEKLLARGWLPGVKNSPEVAALAQESEDLGDTQLGYLVLRPDGDVTAIENNPALTEISYNIALSLGYSVKNLNVKTGNTEIDSQGKDAIYAHLLSTLDEDGIYDLVMKMFRRKYVDSIRRVIRHGLTRKSGKPIRIRVYPSNAFGYSYVKNGKRFIEEVDPDRFVRLINEVNETVVQLVDEVAGEVGTQEKKDLVEVEIAISDTTGEVTDPNREDSLERAKKVFERIVENELEQKNGNGFALHLQNRGLGHLVILKYAEMFSRFGDVVIDVSLGNTGGSPFSALAPGNLESEGTVLGLQSLGVNFRGSTSLPGTLQTSRDVEKLLDDNFVRREAIGLHHVPDEEVERVLNIWRFRNDILESQESSSPVEAIAWRPEDSGYNLDNTNVGRLARTQGFGSYEELLAWSQKEPDAFWDTIARQDGDLGLDWFEPYDTVRTNEGSRHGKLRDRWFVRGKTGGKINLYYNAVERHVKNHGNELAIIWQGENGSRRELTFKEVDDQVGRMAAGLQKLGVKKGVKVAVIMSPLPETEIALLAILKLGAVVDPIDPTSGVDEIAERLQEAKVKVILTVDESIYRGKLAKLNHVDSIVKDGEGGLKKNIRILTSGKEVVDDAVKLSPSVEHVVVLRSISEQTLPLDDVPMQAGRDVWWDQLMKDVANDPIPQTVHTSSEDPAIIHYSSGSTGKPKAIVHLHGGLSVSVNRDYRYDFDLQPGDRVLGWDPKGWMMGPHKTIGVLTNRGTLVITEGDINYSTEGGEIKYSPERRWKLIQEERVTHYGLSPLMIDPLVGDESWREMVQSYDLSSLRFIGSTGSTFGKSSWLWLFETLKVPIIGIHGGTDLYSLLTTNGPLTPMKPGSLLPALGARLDIVDKDGRSTNEGQLVWLYPYGPSQTDGLLGDESGKKFRKAYFQPHEDRWNHGDWARRDEDGFIFIEGRVGSAKKVRGSYVSPGRVESAVKDHPDVADALYLAATNALATDNEIIIFYVLNPGVQPSKKIEESINSLVQSAIGPKFRVKHAHAVPMIPKTRSQKSIHHLMEEAYLGEELGDTSTASAGTKELLDLVRKLGEADRATRESRSSRKDDSENGSTSTPASSPVIENQLPQEVGGIDMNPRNLDLQTKGRQFEINKLLNMEELHNIHIDGFTPVIIHVAPLTNLPLLLGLIDDEDAEDAENVRIIPGRDPMDHPPTPVASVDAPRLRSIQLSFKFVDEAGIGSDFS